MKKIWHYLMSSIGRKIYLLASIGLVIQLLLGGFSFVIFHSLDDTTMMASLERMHSVNAFGAAADFHRYEANNTQEPYDGFKRKLAKAISYSSYFGALPARLNTLASGQLADEMVARYPEIKPDQAFYMAHLVKAMYWHPLMVKLTDTSRQAGEVGEQMLALADEIHQLAPGAEREAKQRQFIELERHIGELADQFNAGVGELAAFALSAAMMSLFVIMLLAAIVLMMVSRSIIKPINRSLGNTVDGIRQLSQGELALKMSDLTADEAGQVQKAMQGLADTLAEIVQRIKGTSLTLGERADELTGTAAHLHQNASDQARVLNEITQAVSATAQTENNIVHSTQEALNLSTKTHELAGDGANSVAQTVSSMARISDSVSTTAETIARLNESRARIGQIVATVESVADQTNLLALNAAIEAARAGEYGRGFGVVAEEIRALAGHSSKATQEIASMLSLIEREVTAASNSMQNCRAAAEDGAHQVSQAASRLNGIVEASSRTRNLISEVALATETHASTTEQLHGNVKDIAQAASATEESSTAIAAAAHDLGVKMSELEAALAWFKVAKSG
jgi:methyl-accepting chemotaxis protein